MRWLITLLIALLAGCGKQATETPAVGRPIPIPHTRTFSVVERDGYRIVDLHANIVTWGGAANGPEQRVRVVLVPRSIKAPALTGDLAGAVMVRTPVKRIAVNYGGSEALLTAIGAADRLVAVGGTKSYDDTIRERVKKGEIGQIGYGWHSPPNLDVLLAAKPDVFLMTIGDPAHADAMRRAIAMGIPVMPVFMANESDYLGPVQYARLFGMLTGRERQGERFVAMVESGVDQVKRAVAALPRRSVLSAWWMNGDTWMVTVRGAANRLLEDAGGINVMRRPDDPRLDDTMQMPSETVLTDGGKADCWLWRDPISKRFADQRFLAHMRAWRDGCVFAADGGEKPGVDAFDLFERGAIRPDLLLRDYARMLHPELRGWPATWVRQDQRAGGSAGGGHGS